MCLSQAPPLSSAEVVSKYPNPRASIVSLSHAPGRTSIYSQEMITAYSIYVFYLPRYLHCRRWGSLWSRPGGTGWPNRRRLWLQHASPCSKHEIGPVNNKVNNMSYIQHLRLYKFNDIFCTFLMQYKTPYCSQSCKQVTIKNTRCSLLKWPGGCRNVYGCCRDKTLLRPLPPPSTTVDLWYFCPNTKFP